MLNLKTKSAFPVIIAVAIMSLYSCSSDDSDDTPQDIPNNVLLRADLSVSPATIIEGESAVITLTLDEVNTTGSDIVFDFTFGGTVDPETDVLSLVSTALVIPDGATETTLEITSVDDEETEETETFTLDISNFPSGTVAGTTVNIVLNISDND